LAPSEHTGGPGRGPDFGARDVFGRQAERR
jgi:hypothetical protein